MPMLYTDFSKVVKIEIFRRKFLIFFLFFIKTYSPFHSSLPFEHLGQSNLFTRVCRLFVNQVTFYSI